MTSHSVLSPQSPVLRAVIFDLDGVLVDSEPLQGQAWDRLLSRYGRALTPEVLSGLYGRRVMDAAEVAVAHYRLDVAPAALAAERDATFLEMLPGNLLVTPGALPLVQALHASGLALAVASSGTRRLVEAALETGGFMRYFDAVATGDEVPVGKPAPDVYLAAAKGLGVEPTYCAAVEDAPNGIASAKAAGMLCIAVPHALTAGLPGLDAADVQLASLDHVLPWLRCRGLRIED